MDGWRWRSLPTGPEGEHERYFEIDFADNDRSILALGRAIGLYSDRHEIDASLSLHVSPQQALKEFEAMMGRWEQDDDDDVDATPAERTFGFDQPARPEPHDEAALNPTLE